MPAERAIVTSSQTAFRRVKWDARTAAIVAKLNVESIVQAGCKHFRVLAPTEEFVLLGQLDGDELELTDESLALLSPKAVLLLSKIQRGAEPSNSVTAVPALAGTMGHAAASSSAPTPRRLQLNFCTETGETLRMNVRRHTPFERIKHVFAKHVGKCEDSLRLFSGGTRLLPEDTPDTFDLEDGDTVDVRIVQLGGKPVIYLSPAEPLESATVSVHLVPQWSFTHVYPLGHSKRLDDGRQSVAWSVSASVDGTLVEEGSGLELSYLFWEAASGATAPLTPPDPDLPLAEHFDPAFPILEPYTPTTVLLSFDDLLPYLDETLKSLTLHTAARNDFITYWLPKLSKQPYVALRFLPQAAYERAAQLEVTPAPDVVTRVFMLFRGVPAELALSDIWAPARERAEEVDWPSVVGVKEDAWDETRFRVLEWGAMEVM